jgi:hypothetical protein
VRAPLVVSAVLVGLLGALAPGCKSSPETGPGMNMPGASCKGAADCGCWTCTCQGIGGAPGGAQLCLSGTCPTADAACATVCDLVRAKVASAKSSESCPGRLSP